MKPPADGLCFSFGGPEWFRPEGSKPMPMAYDIMFFTLTLEFEDCPRGLRVPFGVVICYT